jgi:hypothetical protein
MMLGDVWSGADGLRTMTVELKKCEDRFVNLRPVVDAAAAQEDGYAIGMRHR